MKKIVKNLVSFILIFLMSVVISLALTKEVGAFDWDDLTPRGYAVQNSFTETAELTASYEHDKSGDPGSFYLKDYLYSHILCAEHGQGIPWDEIEGGGSWPDQQPRVLVHLKVESEGDKVFDKDFPDENGYTEWETETWEVEKAWEDPLMPSGGEDDPGGTHEEPTITLTIKRLNYPQGMSRSGWPDPGGNNEEEVTGETVTPYIYTNTYSHATEAGGGSGAATKNSAIAYVYSECNEDGPGLLPAESYVNVASWLLQDNNRAAYNGLTTEYFTQGVTPTGIDTSSAYWMYQEQLDALQAQQTQQAADIEGGAEIDQQTQDALQAHIDALTDIINNIAILETQNDGVSNVEADVALAAGDLYEEAIIFQQMWNVINAAAREKYGESYVENDAGNYAATIADHTRDEAVAGDKLQNLHVQFHTENEDHGEDGPEETYDTYYIVGPFQIEYCEFYTPVDSEGNGGQFCGIGETPKLYVKMYDEAEEGNLKEEELTYGDEWTFEYTQEAFSEDHFTPGRKSYPHIPTEFNDTKYPHSKETFYLKIKYQEGMTAISKMSFKFRVLSATCEYERYQNWLYTQKWSAQATLNSCDDGSVCDHGSAHDSAVDHNATGAIGLGDVDETVVDDDDDDDDDEDLCSDGVACEHGCYQSHYPSIDLEINCEEHTLEQDIQDFIYVVGAARGYGDSAEIITDLDADGTEQEFNWEIDLRTVIDGYIWQDKEPDKATDVTLGLWDKDEEPSVRNVKVNVYWYSSTTGAKIEHNEGLARAYDEENNLVEFPLLTDANGEWNPNKYKFEAPGVATNLFYVVEYIYDGQFFKDAIYLTDGESNVFSSAEPETQAAAKTRAYSNDETVEKSKAVTSYDSRSDFDQSFGIITGSTSMTEGGTTQGYTIRTDASGEEVEGSDDERDTSLQYNTAESNSITNEEGQSAVISRLDEPMDENGGAEKQQQEVEEDDTYYERFELDACTYQAAGSSGGLYTLDVYQLKYPERPIYFMDKIKNEDGTEESPHYIDKYMRHINLGLVKRRETDVSLLKDLYKITVVVNEQKVVYKFNPYNNDTTKSFIELEQALEKFKTEGGKYTLGLYDSDLGYSSKFRYIDAINKVLQVKENTELRVFASYVIRLYNNSEMDDVVFNQVMDYCDSDYTLVQPGVDDDYVFDEHGNLIAPIINDYMKREDTPIAESPYFRVCSTGDAYTWNATREENEEAADIKGTVEWTKEADHKYSTNSLRRYDGSLLRIANDEYIEIFTTYEVDKAGYDAIRESEEGMSPEEAINAREKLLTDEGHSNTAEISNYSTFYGMSNIYRNYVGGSDGEIAGRVDKDSAPNNIELGTYSTYEDDTYEAPYLAIKMKETERTTSGVVFEDIKDNTATGYSVDPEGVKHTEAISVKVGDGVYTTGTDVGIEDVKVSLYEVINLGSVNANGDTEGVDRDPMSGLEYYYNLDNAYKDISDIQYSTTTDSNGSYTIEGFLAGDYILRFDYGDTSISTDKVYSMSKPNGETVDVIKYNGQDYENTKFLGDKLTADGNQLDMKFLPINGKDPGKLNEADVSKARDNESRRVSVISYSRTIENERAEILRDRELTNEEYIENTKMFAETPIMCVEVEEPTKITTDSEPYNSLTSINIYEYADVKEGEENGLPDDLDLLVKEHVNIEKIDFGLEERARTDIELKNMINMIQVIKQNTVVFRINVNDDGSLDYTADTSKSRKVTSMPTTYLSSLNQQGFYAIEMEANYLSGLSIQIRYKTEVVNNSEIDFTGRLNGIYRQDVLKEYVENVPTTEFYEDLVAEAYSYYTEEVLSVDDIGDDDFLLTTNANYAIYEAVGNTYGIHEDQETDMIKPEVVVYGMLTGRFYYENTIYNENIDYDDYEIKDYIRGEDVDTIMIDYERDHIVRTTVNNLVDYVDVDASFDIPLEGKITDAAWSTMGDGDLNGEDQVSIVDNKVVYEADSDYEVFDGLISDASYRIHEGNIDFFDNKDRKYIVRGKSRIGFSDNDSMTAMADYPTRREYASGLKDDINNEKLIKELEPIDYVLPSYMEDIRSGDKEPNYQGVDEAYKSRFLGTNYVYVIKITENNTAAGDIHIENLAEVLIYSNPTGRRDVFSVPGNALSIGATAVTRGGSEQSVWHDGYNSIRSKGYAAANLIANSARADASRTINTVTRQWTAYPEDDQWSPEYISVIPPTGIAYRLFVKNNLPIIIASTLAILGLAIVFIRKQFKIRKEKK